MPSGKVDKPIIQDNRDGTVSVKYEPREEGSHELVVKYNGEPVQGKYALEKNYIDYVIKHLAHDYIMSDKKLERSLFAHAYLLLVGSPFKFHVDSITSGYVTAYGPGLTHGVTGEPANFTISTKGASAGGLTMAVEGPSKADVSYQLTKMRFQFYIYI